MKVGLIGLGHIGFPIARHLHECGHEIFSWTRNERKVVWNNSLNLDMVSGKVVASGELPK